MWRCGTTITLIIACAGCARQPNPSFPLTEAQAASALDEMRADPVPLHRPLVILGGFADAGLGTSVLRFKIDRAFERPDILVVTFADCTTFEQCRQRVVAAVAQRWGMASPSLTAQVDLVGESMGGLVAVVSATDFEDGSPRVNASRIFTLSSPLRGARLAEASPVLLTPMQRDLKPDSRLYARLQAMQINSELYSYSRLDDDIVGEDYASLDGHSTRWVDTPPMQVSHIKGVIDDRILADVLRRLRGETPYSQDPPSPVPTRS